jgi:hypothetical protein
MSLLLGVYISNMLKMIEDKDSGGETKLRDSEGRLNAALD